MRIIALILGILGGLVGLVSGVNLGAGALVVGLFGGGLLQALLTLLALGASLAGIVSGIVAAVRPRPGGVLMLVVGVGLVVVFTLLSLSLGAKGVRGEGLENAYWLAGALLIVGGVVGLRAGRQVPAG